MQVVNLFPFSCTFTFQKASPPCTFLSILLLYCSFPAFSPSVNIYPHSFALLFSLPFFVLNQIFFGQSFHYCLMLWHKAEWIGQKDKLSNRRAMSEDQTKQNRKKGLEKKEEGARALFTSLFGCEMSKLVFRRPQMRTCRPKT